MAKKIMVYDKENNSLMCYGLKTKRIDICESHTIIYGFETGQDGNEVLTIHLPFTLKSVCFQSEVVLVYWLNDFYAIIDNA